MFQFYWPWLALLLPVPFLIKWLFPSAPKQNNGAPVLHFPAINRIKKAFPLYDKANKQSNKGFYIFLSLAWIFLVIALMQPERVDKLSHIKNKGYDLMLAVDISGSMQAVDFSTQTKVVSRLDATKDVVGKFVLGRSGDRVGLVTFGENAYLHVPLTLDTLSVSKMLNDTTTGMAGNATSIGDAIGLSVRTLRERPEGSRVLVLLTDGEDNSSSIPPLEAAKLAKQYGVRIFTIGVGQNGQVPFPNQFGGYSLANVRIDEKLLKEIAEMTDGEFFMAKDQKTLETIYSKIDQMVKTESNETVFLIREPLYYYPLAFAMLFIILSSLYEMQRRRVVHGS